MPVYYDEKNYDPKKIGGYPFRLDTKYKDGKIFFYCCTLSKNGERHRLDGAARIYRYLDSQYERRDYFVDGQQTIQTVIIALNNMSIEKMPLYINRGILRSIAKEEINTAIAKLKG